MLSVIVLAGLSIDGSNGIRAKEQLQTAADIAAHAGIVALANGEDAASIRSVVASAAGWNMPSETYGDLLGDATENVRLGVFSDGSFVSGDSQSPDTVQVRLSMNKSRGNPVRAFLLNFVGMDSWDVVASSLATYQQSELCSGNDGVFAWGAVRLTESASFGPDVCIFSKLGVDLAGHDTFQSGSRVAMPDLSDCLMCDDAHNPGIENAKREINLQFTNVSGHNAASMASMLGVAAYESPRRDFFGGLTLDSDLTPLAELGYNTSVMDKGEVVQISAADFASMNVIPTGLVYAVYCRAPLSSYSAHVPTSPAGTDGNGGGGVSTTLTLETMSGSGISDVAVVTNCLLNFGPTADVQNAIIATESESYISVSAAPGARIGSSSTSCSGSGRVVVLTQGDAFLPAELQINNVDFLIAGDLELAPGPTAQSTTLGVSYFVAGEAKIAAQGNWVACGGGGDSFNGDLKVIRHVVPTGPDASTTLH